MAKGQGTTRTVGSNSVSASRASSPSIGGGKSSARGTIQLVRRVNNGVKDTFNVTSSLDKVKNEIIHRLMDSRFLNSSLTFTSVDDYVQKVGDKYVVKVWNLMDAAAHRYEIVSVGNNTSTTIEFVKEGSKYVAYEKRIRYYGFPSTRERLPL